MADLLTDVFVRLRQKLKLASGRILSDTSLVEDILQDSFVQLWRRHYPLKSEKEAEALLTRTVRNASLNEKRRKRMAPLENDYPDDSPDAKEREQSFVEMERRIETELTATQRHILEEKEYGGRTLNEIAKDLDMDPAAVRMQISRARRKLRDALKDDR